MRRNLFSTKQILQLPQLNFGSSLEFAAERIYLYDDSFFQQNQFSELNTKKNITDDKSNGFGFRFIETINKKPINLSLKKLSDLNEVISLFKVSYRNSQVSIYRNSQQQNINKMPDENKSFSHPTCFLPKTQRGLFYFDLLANDFTQILKTRKLFVYLFKNQHFFKLIYGNMKHRVLKKLFKSTFKTKNKTRLSLFNLFFFLEKRLTSILYLSFLIPKLTTLKCYLFEGHVLVNKNIVRKYNFHLHPDDIIGLSYNTLPYYSNGFLFSILGLHHLFYRFFRTKYKNRSGIHASILSYMILLNMISRDDLSRRRLGYYLNSNV